MHFKEWDSLTSLKGWKAEWAEVDWVDCSVKESV